MATYPRCGSRPSGGVPHWLRERSAANDRRALLLGHDQPAQACDRQGSKRYRRKLAPPSSSGVIDAAETAMTASSATAVPLHLPQWCIRCRTPRSLFWWWTTNYARANFAHTLRQTCMPSTRPRTEPLAEAISRFRPRLVLLNPTLGGLDMHEVCRFLREVSRIPFVFVSPVADPERVIAGLELGADDYVIKPYITLIL